MRWFAVFVLCFLVSSCTTSGKFELSKSNDNQYYWVLKAANGEKILQSETYTTKQKAMEGIEAVRKYAPGAVLVDTTTTTPN